MTDQTPLWSSAAAIAATGGSCPVNWAAFGVSIDTRTLQKGDLFVALPGPSFDGHDFIVKALEAGAAAALGHRRPEGLAKDAPFLQVTDALAGLRDLAAARRLESQARILAVTGSVGKTSTKEALRQCLAASGATHASSASHNNHWGVPLSLARLPLAARFGVFEIGMNHADEIRPLSRLARPHVAVITMIAPAHIENFREGLIGIADAKSEIFEGLEPGGIAVLPRDIALYHHLHLRANEAGVTNFLSFGRHKEADVRLVDCKLNPTCSAVSAEIAGEKLDYCLSLPGEHMAMNSLAVLAAVKAAGGDLHLAAAEMARLPSLKGRGQRQRITMPNGAFDLIDDSYNANPASMRAAFAVLAQASLGAGGRRLAVLGDMLELGAQAQELHAGLAPDLLAAKVDRIFLCGPKMKALWEKLPAQNRGAYSADSSQLAPQVAAAIQPGDTVLVKGSLGSRMAVVVAALSALSSKQRISA